MNTPEKEPRRSRWRIPFPSTRIRPTPPMIPRTSRAGGALDLHRAHLKRGLARRLQLRNARLAHLAQFRAPGAAGVLAATVPGERKPGPKLLGHAHVPADGCDLLVPLVHPLRGFLGDGLPPIVVGTVGGRELFFHTCIPDA